MARIKSEQHLDTDRLIGQCLGAGLSVEKTAEHLGIHANTVRNHIDGNKAFIFKVKAEIETLLALNTAATVVKTADKAEDRIKSVFNRAFALTEKAIGKVETLGDAATLEELMDMHKQITVWAGKFAASEAPKRLEVGGTVNHDHRVLLDETVDGITAFQTHMQRLLPPVIDVEPEPAH